MSGKTFFYFYVSLLCFFHFPTRVVFGVDPDSLHDPVYSLTKKQKEKIKNLNELDKAILEHNYTQIEQLISSGKFNLAQQDLEGVTYMMKACIVEDTKAMELLKKLGHNLDDYSLFYSVIHNKLSNAQTLLKLGANPNKIVRGITITRLAEFDENKPMIDLLKQYGGVLGTGIVKGKSKQK